MVETITPFEALQLAADRAGSGAALGRICGVSPTAVWKWMQTTKRLPAEHALKVEAGTGVDRRWLAPDHYPYGLIDGVPYAPEEPLLDVFTPVTFPSQHTRHAARDQGGDARFHGVDRRAGAHA